MLYLYISLVYNNGVEWKIYLEIVVMVATAKLFVAMLRDLVSILWTYDCVTPQCTV